jgi:hypothetical protein
VLLLGDTGTWVLALAPPCRAATVLAAMIAAADILTKSLRIGSSWVGFAVTTTIGREGLSALP